MAKELHIKIDKQIGGLYIDEFGWLSAGYSANELDYALSEMPNPRRLIIHASSPGGDIEQGFKIYNRLLDLRNAGTEIHVINEAKAYSIMTFIAMAASPGKLFARQASMWSVHKPMAVVFDMLNADELRKISKELDSFESVIVNAYMGRTGMSESAVQAYLREDLIINSEEALTQGWIDEIIPDEETTVAAVESAKMVAWKPVAFLPTKQTEENKMTEAQENSIVDKIVNKVSSFFNNKPQEQPAQQDDSPATVMPEPTPAPEPQPDPKEEELERLRQENEQLKQQQQEAQQQAQADAQAKDNELQTLRQQVEAFNKTVPGSGNPQNSASTVHVDHGQGKEVTSPFALLEQNAKNLKNNRARKN